MQTERIIYLYFPLSQGQCIMQFLHEGLATTLLEGKLAHCLIDACQADFFAGHEATLLMLYHQNGRQGEVEVVVTAGLGPDQAM